MSQRLIVKKGHATCPNCHTEFDVTSKVNGLGSKPQGDAKLRKQVKGYKKEIICAYINSYPELQATRDIITSMNNMRSPDRQVERSNITRAHSELIDAGIIRVEYHEGIHAYHSININKAKALIEGGKF